MKQEELKVVSCACEQCKEMCRHSTCLPTPAEARILIRRGYGPRLARYEWTHTDVLPNAIGPAPKEHEGKTLNSTLSGRCTFLTDDDRCELHALGLKPLEGRLALHDRSWIAVRREVLQHWKGKRYESVACGLLNPT